MNLRRLSLNQKVELLIRMMALLLKMEGRELEELQNMADDAQTLQDAFDRHEQSVKDAVAEIVKLIKRIGNAGLTQKVKDIASALDASTQELKDAIAGDPDNTPAPVPEPVPAPEPAPTDGGTSVDNGTPTV